jgi:hypothetical protein
VLCFLCFTHFPTVLRPNWTRSGRRVPRLPSQLIPNCDSEADVQSSSQGQGLVRSKR